jgi:uncharacterized protein (TIGR03067 family)
MDADRLEGIWEMTRAELAGEEAPEVIVRKTQLELSAGNYCVRFDGCIMDEGTYAAIAGDDQKKLTLIGTSGSNAGRSIPCIYQLVGDRLRVCYGLDGIIPSTFTATCQQRYLASYRRKSPGAG